MLELIDMLIIYFMVVRPTLNEKRNAKDKGKK